MKTVISDNKIITKHYSVTRWSYYREIAKIGDTHGMSVTRIPTVVGGLACTIINYMNDETGNGFETRAFAVPSDMQ